MTLALHSIRLPFHLELNHVWVHLAACDGGYLMIDAGFGNEASMEALAAGLREAGVAWKDIHTLILTHAHPDHMGLVTQIQELSGARLWMHARDVEFLKRITSERGEENLLRWGTPAALADRVVEASKSTGKYFRVLTPDRLIEDGDRVGPFTAVWTPGHAPGHLCYFEPGSRTLIAGDHVLPEITPHVSWSEGEDALADFLRSLERVAAMDVAVVVPSHGEVFRDLPGRVAEITEHHRLRCNAVMEALASGARTPHDIVGRLWRQTLSPFQYRFGIYEVMAHLEYLERNGTLSAGSSYSSMGG